MDVYSQIPSLVAQRPPRRPPGSEGCRACPKPCPARKAPMRLESARQGLCRCETHISLRDGRFLWRDQGGRKSSDLKRLQLSAKDARSHGKVWMGVFSEDSTGALEVDKVAPFLLKLYEIVSSPVSDDLVCWSEHGETFKIVNRTKFAGVCTTYARVGRSSPDHRWH